MTRGRATFGSRILLFSRKKFHLVQREPAPQAAGCFNTVPMRRDNYDDDLSIGRKIGNVGGGAKRRGFQACARRLNPSLYFVPQGIDALFEILYGRLRGNQESCLIFALSDEGLSSKIHTLATPLGLGRLLCSKLNGLEMTLNNFVFARFDGAVRQVHSAMCRLDENGINTQACALGTNTRDHITDRDRPPVCTLRGATAAVWRLRVCPQEKASTVRTSPIPPPD